MASSAYRRENGRGGRRFDVKQRTISRFAQLDEDVASRYELDEDEERLPITQTTRSERQEELGGRDRGLRGRTRIINRQIQMSAAGKRQSAYKVVVRTFGKSDVDYVMQTIGEMITGFLPFNIGPDMNKNVCFYVHTEEEADSLKQLSRRVYHPSDPNEKFTIIAQRTVAPWEHLDPRIKQAVRDVVIDKFNAQTNTLDLSAFQFHKIFADRDLTNLCSLSRNAVFCEAVRVAAEICPQVTALSLKRNRLAIMDNIGSMTFACPGVVELDLSDNNFENVNMLGKIRRWNIERLFLENNPLTASFSDASSYTNAIHDFLPRVSFLDGTAVRCDPFKITAENQRRAGIIYPPVQENYCPDVSLKQRVEGLLVQFYDLYDGKPAEKTRQLLVNAYDDEAVFTQAICILPYLARGRNQMVPKGDEDAFRTCIRSSHNVVHEDKWTNYREKIVYKGAMAIAVALSAMPQTEHDKGSFQLEFLTVRPQLLIFTVRGLLRDGIECGRPDGATKFFVRTMAVVPRGEDRMAIVNDDLVLTPISSERLQKYNDLLKKASEAPVDPQPTALAVGIGGLAMHNGAGPSGLQQELQRRQLEQQRPMPIVPAALQPPPQPAPAQPAPAHPAAAAYDKNDPQVQQMMVEAFSQQSGMKPEWSRKCLEELNWDFNAAGEAFNSRQGMIPAEAFM